MTTVGAVRIALAAAMLCGAGQASAQNITGQVVGRVLDADTGKPIAGASVTAKSRSNSWLDQSVRTDATGYYVLSLLPPGHYTVSVEAKGYESRLPRDVRVLVDWRIKNDVRMLATNASAPAVAAPPFALR